MNNPKFYIYGVPDGFNMLSGTPEEILYYQLFYDTSKRGREMRINRKANGETVYSYLIYNLVSCKGREGAFLGMSIVFTGNEYCNDPVSLKELFDGVYNEVILKADDKDKIIAAIDGGNAVGRFCISKFAERQGMCERIGRIIINNVVGELSSSISTIDASFDNNREGRILTLPIEADKTSINQALRSYTWISLSSECKAIPVPSQQSNSPITLGHRKISPIVSSQDLLSVHFINELANKVGSYKDFIIQSLKGLVSIHEITAKREEINHCLDTIEEYIGRQPVLGKLKDDYMKVYKELADLKLQQPNLRQNSDNPPLVERDDSNDWLKNLVHKNLSRIIACVCAIPFVVLVWIFWPDNLLKARTDASPKTEMEEAEGGKDDMTTFNKNRFESLLDSANYRSAWNMLQEVKDAVTRENLTQVLQNSYRKWFNKEFENRKDNKLDLLKLQQEIAAYVDFNRDNESNIQLINEEINLLEKTTGNDGTNGVARGGNAAPNYGKPTAISPKVRIYEADCNYKKISLANVDTDNIITCKKNATFVIDDVKRFEVHSGSSIQVNRPDKNKDEIRIKAPNLGSHRIQLNQNTYIFNVSP